MGKTIRPKKPLKAACRIRTRDLRFVKARTTPEIPVRNWDSSDTPTSIATIQEQAAIDPVLAAVVAAWPGLPWHCGEASWPW